MGSSSSKLVEIPAASSLIRVKSQTDLNQQKQDDLNQQEQDECKQAQQFVIMSAVEQELVETMQLLQGMCDPSLNDCTDSLGDASPENIKKLQKLPGLLTQLSSPRLQQLLQYVALSKKYK